MNVQLQIELNWLRESVKLSQPKIVQKHINGEYVGLRVYSNYTIIDFPKEQLKRIKVEQFEVLKCTDEKSELEKYGLGFYLTHDCNIENLNFKPKAIVNTNEFRTKVLKRYIKHLETKGYNQEREVLDYPTLCEHFTYANNSEEGKPRRPKVKVKRVNEWISTELYKGNLRLYRDYEEQEDEYINLLVGFYVMKSVLANHRVVKTNINTYENKVSCEFFDLKRNYGNTGAKELYQTIKNQCETESA